MDYIRELRALVGHRPLLMPAAAVLIFDAEGRVLLQLRGDNGRWGVPGGAMEPGESLEQTARREVWEETGLTVGRLTFVDIFSGPEFFGIYPNGDQVYTVCAVYVAEEVTGTLTVDGGETLDLQFYALDALPDDMVATSHRFVDRYRAMVSRLTPPDSTGDHPHSQ